MNKLSNQNEAIIDFLTRHPTGKKHGITANTAFDLLGITSLSRRICDLEKQGYDFDRTVKRFENRYGNPSSAMWYMLRMQNKHG